MQFVKKGEKRKNDKNERLKCKRNVIKVKKKVENIKRKKKTDEKFLSKLNGRLNGATIIAICKKRGKT